VLVIFALNSKPVPWKIVGFVPPQVEITTRVNVDRRQARLRMVRDLFLRTSHASGRGRDPLIGGGDTRHGEDQLAGGIKPT
jgi:hypothetical protein